MSDSMVVCLCGSTRFKDEWVEAYKSLARNGHVPLTVGFFHHADGEELDADTKRALDASYKHKIDLADKVFVVNKNGYVGYSTRTEVAHAVATRTPVQWLEPDQLVSPAGGGCWFCSTDGGELAFDTEFDTFYHVECLDATGAESVLDFEHRDLGGVD